MTWDARDVPGATPQMPPPPLPDALEEDVPLTFGELALPTYAQTWQLQQAHAPEHRPRSWQEEQTIMSSGLYPGFIPHRAWGLLQLWATRGIPSFAQEPEG